MCSSEELGGLDYTFTEDVPEPPISRYVPRGLHFQLNSNQTPDPPKEEGENVENIVDRPRAEALLQWAGKAGFRPMEESIKEVFDTMA